MCMSQYPGSPGPSGLHLYLSPLCPAPLCRLADPGSIKGEKGIATNLFLGAFSNVTCIKPSERYPRSSVSPLGKWVVDCGGW